MQMQPYKPLRSLQSPQGCWGELDRPQHRERCCGDELPWPEVTVSGTSQACDRLRLLQPGLRNEAVLRKLPSSHTLYCIWCFVILRPEETLLSVL